MKISAVVCNPDTKSNEPDLEFFLRDSSHNVSLMVRDKNRPDISPNYVVLICKDSGKMAIAKSIDKRFGLPLNTDGSLQFKE